MDQLLCIILVSRFVCLGSRSLAILVFELGGAYLVTAMYI